VVERHHRFNILVVLGLLHCFTYAHNVLLMLTITLIKQYTSAGVGI
jgi:hypothetical protein